MTRATLALVAAHAVAALAAFLTQVGTARALRPQGYGDFAVALSILVWAEPLVASGLTVPLARLAATGERSLGWLWAWARRVYLTFSLVVFLLAVAVSPLAARGVGDGGLAVLMIVALLEIPFMALFAAARDLLMGAQAAGRQATATAVHAVLRAGLVTAAASATGSAAAALAGNALAAALTALVSWWLLRPLVGAAPARDVPAPRPASGAARWPDIRLLGAGVPVLVTVVATQVAMTADLWIVKRVGADGAAVGGYAAVRFVAATFWFLSSALSVAAFPRLVAALARGRAGDAARIVRTSVAIVGIVLVPVVGVLWAAPESIVTALFSATYAGASAALPALAAGIALLAAVGILQSALVAADRAWLAACLAIALAAVSFVAGVALVPAWGTIGAARAMVVTGIAGLVLFVPAASTVYRRRAKPAALLVPPTGEAAAEDRPLVSVVIPTYNRRPQLARCLEALAVQRYPRFEVIVVDDASTDDTARWLADFAARHPALALRTLRNDTNRGANHGRNRAVAVARGAIIAFLDSDSVPRSDWLEQIERVFAAHPDTAAVVGAIHDPPPRNVFELTHRGANRVVGPRTCRLVSCNMAIRRDDMLRCGWDEDRRFQAWVAPGVPDTATSGGCDEEGISLMLAAAGRPMRVADDAIVVHEHFYTGRSLFRQAYVGGGSAAHLVYKYRLRTRADILPFLLGYGSLPLTAVDAVLGVVPALCFAAACAALLYNDIRRKGKTIGQTLTTFPILVAYYHVRVVGYVVEALRLRLGGRTMARIDLGAPSR